MVGSVSTMCDVRLTWAWMGNVLGEEYGLGGGGPDDDRTVGIRSRCPV